MGTSWNQGAYDGAIKLLMWKTAARATGEWQPAFHGKIVGSIQPAPRQGRHAPADAFQIVVLSQSLVKPHREGVRS